MKKIIIYIFLGILVSTAYSVGGAAVNNNPQLDLPEVDVEIREEIEELMKEVKKAQEDGLPRTAKKKLDKIVSLALEGEDYNYYLKAVVQKIMFESIIQGNKPAVKVNMLKDEIEKADERLEPVLKAILARWYWHFFSSSRWRFQQRSETASIDDEDIMTWDLNKIINEIDNLYKDILDKEEILSQIKTSFFKEFLHTDKTQINLRPTLYDFLVWEAINFYSQAEQHIVKPVDAYEINFDSDVSKTTDEFLKYEAQTTDFDSPKYKVVSLYQKLIKLHKNKNNYPALADTELNRIIYVKNNGFGDKKLKSETTLIRLKETLQISDDENVDAAILYNIAKTYYDIDDRVKALEYAVRGYELYPETNGGESCKNLSEQILARRVNIKGQRLYSTKEKRNLEVEYKNVSKLYFRIYEDEWDTFLKQDNTNPYREDRERLNSLLKQGYGSPGYYKSWSSDVEETPDYKEKTQTVTLPEIEPGFYRIFSSFDGDFSDLSKLSYSWFWVSDLGVVTRPAENKITGFILDNYKGTPLKNIAVTLYGYKNRRYREYKNVLTDKDGYFEVSTDTRDYYNFIVHAKTENDEILDLSTTRGLSSGRASRKSENILFMTDRALYRPGQSIHFKGIVVDVDGENDNYKVKPDKNVEIKFIDVNREEIETVELRSNDFGSISGTFTAPTDGLTGSMTIRASGIAGSTRVQVEEYKRPKFSVELERPEEEYRVDDTVKVPGQAVSYSGAPVNNAHISFRVRREVRFPFWYSWFYGRGFSSEAQEVAYGTALTDSAGNFILEFEAVPDRLVAKDGQPVFNYTVYCDVTDSTGETRSDNIKINVGYHSANLNISAAESVHEEEDFKFNVNATSLNGVDISASGQINIFKLLEPDKPVRDDVQIPFIPFKKVTQPSEVSKEDFGHDPKRWPAGKNVYSRNFKTTAGEKSEYTLNLKPGLYRIMAETEDRYGQTVESMHNFKVLPSKQNKDFNLKIPFYTSYNSSSVLPGNNLELVWGTGYEEGRAFVEIVHRGETLKSFWTEPGQTQQFIEFPVKEKYRGGFGVCVTFVAENRFYIDRKQIQVPYTNKELLISFETFRDKLYPGEKEKWIINIEPREGDISEAELAAVLYDSSLDAFYPHSWPDFNFFRTHRFMPNYRYSNSQTKFSGYSGDSWSSHGRNLLLYPKFPDEVTRLLTYHQFSRSASGRRQSAVLESASPSEMSMKADAEVAEDKEVEQEEKEELQQEPDEDIHIRENLDETAFFYPDLIMKEDGSVSLEFTMPEALTKWKFMGFAHTKDASRGKVEEYTVTQKELMIEPNPPRFLRENDELEFTAKISNLSENDLNIRADLNLLDLISDDKVNTEFGLNNTLKYVNIKSGLSETVSWKINVPRNAGSVRYEIRASGGNYSDGQADAIPVLSSRMLIKESLPLWISEAGKNTFEFDNLKQLDTSDTIDAVHFSVEMSSNPAWYAIQALPYLMEYPYESLDSTFNRYYANSLAANIANSNPSIRKIFDSWKNEYQDELKSPLQKNEDLKNISLQDTPWVAQASREREQKAKIGLLFEENNLRHGLNKAYEKIKEAQNADGSWPWFPGGRANPYITLYILTGFGRLRHLDVSGDNYAALRALNYMDGWIKKTYDNLRDKERNNLNNIIALYLYTRSFYNEIKPVPTESQEAVKYFLEQADKHWLSLNSRLGQGYIALALKRFKKESKAEKIMNSLYERSVYDEEMGRFWREDELSLYWYRAKIETQALMIEAFDEVSGDAQTVKECKVWLLKQKQTQNWKSSKATADAIYSLILRGADILEDNEIVKMTVGNEEVDIGEVTPGVNSYKKIYPPSEISSDFKNITVERKTDGVSWGGAYFHYVEDISKVKAHQTDLSLEKSLWLTKHTESGPVIEKVDGELKPGDQVKLRIVLRTDRDLEYVHLKDYRASGMEPENVISRWKYQDGLRYYESTGDTSTNFFISYMPKGTYVFEYPVRIQHKGTFETGPAKIQCMYAPEFSSHSESIAVEVTGRR
ncbi:MAG: alpha-2-macroglobulin family protein [Candidatus Muiribacteriota bacterium]